MKVAILGIRGIPSKYGGFETFAEQLALRLVEKGHQVTVYGRKNIIDYKNKNYKGVKLIILTTISHKYLDTITHTLLSVVHSLFCQYDVVLICNAANSIFSFIPRLVKQKVVVNVDGVERRRKKWNRLGKIWYLMGEMCSCVFPNEIVTDAQKIREYYLKRYNKESTMIPYGYNTEKLFTLNILNKFKLKPRQYVLFVSRLEPENNAHVVIEAFKKVNTKKKLVIVGDAPYANKYKQYLKSLAESHNSIIFTGFIFGNGYKELQSYAYCYIHAGEVGGTPPALVEAMGFGNCVIVNGTNENKEVVGNAGLIYKKNDIENLRKKLQYVIDNPDIIKDYREKAQVNVKQRYSWNAITDKYEGLFKSLIIKKNVRKIFD